MRRRGILLAALLWAAPAVADMYQDASNAKLPEARANLHAQPALDARDYGVKCDNAANDLAALQTAVDAAETGGKSVFLPAGTCLLGSALQVKAGVALQATQGTATIKPAAGNIANPMLMSMYGNNTVYGLTLDGGGQDFATASNVVQLYGVANVVFDTVKFQNTRGIAILASTGVKNSGVRDSAFVNIGNRWKTTLAAADRQQAIAFCCGATADNYGNFVVNSTFTDVGLDPVSTGAQKDFLFAGNKCEMAQNQHALVPTSAYGGCFYSVGNDAVTVVSNIIDGAAGNGIDILDTKTALVSGNTVTKSGDCGIGIFGTTSASVAGNIVTNSGQWASAAAANGGNGICLNNASNGLRISVSGNVATDNQGTKTQRYGIGGGGTFVELQVGSDNVFSGNLLGAVTGPLVVGVVACSVVTAGATITIKNGLVTGFTGC